MPVTLQQLCEALKLFEQATKDLVDEKTLHHGALTRLQQLERTADVRALAQKIGKKASTKKKGKTGAGMNGVTLDQRYKASLESLVLHYANRDSALFRPEIVRAIADKLAAHHGPRFLGPWPGD